MKLNETVTWRAKHLGVWQRLTTKIVATDRPRHFRDSMVRGAFKRFDHDHWFDALNGGASTRMRDRFDFNAPLPLLGWMAERLFLTRYMTRFLLERNAFIKSAAEGELWRKFVPE
jgi:ligand-binding SRPBCC domain-containing protein